MSNEPSPIEWAALIESVPAGWQSAEPLGSALDTVFDEAVQHASVDPDLRGPGRVHAADVALLTYSIRAATRAVRTQDTAPLHLAANALALAQPVSDHRELLRRIAVVADAAPRIGTSLDAIAEAMATKWQPSRLARMAAFSSTHPGTTRA